MPIASALPIAERMMAALRERCPEITKLVAAGRVTGPSFSTDTALARYHPDGTLDATFGSGGLVTTDLEPGRPDEANALVLQTDGKLVTAGSRSSFVSTDFALARYLARTFLPTVSTLGFVAGRPACTCDDAGSSQRGSCHPQGPGSAPDTQES